MLYFDGGDRDREGGGWICEVSFEGYKYCIVLGYCIEESDIVLYVIVMKVVFVSMMMMCCYFCVGSFFVYLCNLGVMVCLFI